ncbi:MAG: prepilin-type N-terminal cleavage/methylation domain-containing protein [Puniceicoccales bacterium]|nr:prepilin-type N-terminal cleavage/methylation domain-containing protein [Puniceicoccales bacterium]
MKDSKYRKAFTLVEMIIVTSIIALLMTIILPATQKVLLNSRKTKARTCMKEIAGAYCRYYQENGYIPDATSSVALAEALAKNGELNNANLFVFPGDSKAATVRRENIWPRDDDAEAWEIDINKRLSVCLIGNITSEVDAATTPIAFSRGLSEDGKWSSSEGVYGSDGGFIAFLDGQVRWYKDLSEDDGKLFKAGSNEKTSNINEAIPAEAKNLETLNTQY